MKCTFCDSELPESATRCEMCGAPVASVRANDNTEMVVKDSIEPEPIDTESLYNPPVSQPIPPPYSPPFMESSQPPELTVPPRENIPSSSDAASYGLPSTDDKILGLPADRMGMISMVLGGVGILFSCVGCGGLISLVGLVVGFLALKTTNRSNGITGMILSGIGLLISIVIACVAIFLFSNTGGDFFY